VRFFFLSRAFERTRFNPRRCKSLSAHASNTSGPPSAPRLAIILDDLGSDRAAAEAIFALPYPLTISVLPNHDHSTEIANEAHRRGYQVMLHLPMQSIANENSRGAGIASGHAGDAGERPRRTVLAKVPGATGVNNHQGSQATTSRIPLG